MDDILQRMLAVEEEADAVLRKAEKEAENIAARNRQDAAELQREMRDATEEQANALIQERINDANRAKEEALQAARAGLDARLKEFREKIRNRAHLIVEALAYPMSAP